MAYIPYPMRLLPVIREDHAGGAVLKTRFFKEGGENIIESIELSAEDGSLSVIDNGELSGKALAAFIKNEPHTLGTRAKKFPFFPMTVRFIDTGRDTGAGLHPADGFAQRNDKRRGTDKCWYIAAAEYGAGIHLGFCRDIGRQEFFDAAQGGRVKELMNFYKVAPGEIYNIPAGTPFAVSRGVTLIETAESGGTMYNLDGSSAADIEKASYAGSFNKLDAPTQGGLFAAEKNGNVITHMAHNKYYSVYELRIKREMKLTMNERSFNALTFLSGEGQIQTAGADPKTENYKPGDTFFIPCPAAGYTITGTGKALMCKLEGDNMHKVFDKEARISDFK